MPINSRRKGKAGELEVVRILKEHGYDARRGQQYCGANGDADVIGLDGVHLEIKRTEQLRLYDALDQAKRDARENETPVVIHRKNDCEWVAIMRFDDWLDMYERGRLEAEDSTEDIMASMINRYEHFLREEGLIERNEG